MTDFYPQLDVISKEVLIIIFSFSCVCICSRQDCLFSLVQTCDTRKRESEDESWLIALVFLLSGIGIVWYIYPYMSSIWIYVFPWVFFCFCFFLLISNLISSVFQHNYLLLIRKVRTAQTTLFSNPFLGLERHKLLFAQRLWGCCSCFSFSGKMVGK